MNCIFQFAFPRIVERIGLRRVFINQLFPSLHQVSIREPGVTSFQPRHEPDGRAVHHVAVQGNIFL
jgi:hypothetical protein